MLSQEAPVEHRTTLHGRQNTLTNSSYFQLHRDGCCLARHSWGQRGSEETLQATAWERMPLANYILLVGQGMALMHLHHCSPPTSPGGLQRMEVLGGD